MQRRRRRNEQRALLRTTLLGVLLVALPGAAAPQDAATPVDVAAAPIVVEQLGGTILGLTPQVVYESAVLRISGPDDYALTRRFDSGAVISVDLLAEAEPREASDAEIAEEHGSSQRQEALPDGRYRYEVVFTDGNAEPRVHSGLFFVESGQLLSRGEMRARLADVGQELAKADATEGAGSSEPEVGTEDDWFVVVDGANDGITYVGLDSDGAAGSNLYWTLANVNGDFEVVEDTNFNLPGTTRMHFERGGDVGIGTTAPQRRLHVTGTFEELLRLENTAAGGGTAGLVRDVSGQFRIQVPSGTTRFLVNDQGSVSSGLFATPQARLHVFDNDPTRHDRVLTRLTGTAFPPQFEYEDGSTGDIWREGMNPSGHFVINQMDDPGVAEMRITPGGQVFVNGTQVHPDYVFEEDYSLMPLDELEQFVRDNGHLPGVVSSEEADGKVDLSSFPLQLLEKVEELSLYAIQQEKTIQELKAAKDARIAQLEERLAALEALLHDQVALK
jgi:hypothetical protein